MSELQALGVRLVPAGKRHARELGRVMRPEDWEEIKLSGGWPTPEVGVRASVNRSCEAWAAYAGDALLCVFGVVKMPLTGGGEAQCAWAMTSVHVNAHPVAFWKASKIVIDDLRDKYPRMLNMVHAKYAAALRWLKRLGFKVYAPEKWGRGGGLFCRVELFTERIYHV